MKKELAKTDASILVSNNGTGIDTGPIRYKPSKIKILQDSKQQKYFKKGVDISTKDFGKLFLSMPDVTIGKDKLVDSFEGTLLRYGLGFTVVEVDNDGEYVDFVGSRDGMIGVNGVMTKEDFAEWYPTYKHTNMARLILCVGTPEEVKETLSVGGNPFVSLDLKGSAYGVSFSMFDKMSAAVQDSKELKDLLKAQKEQGGDGKPSANVYKIRISSEKQTNAKGQEFYIPTVEIEINDLEDAVSLQKVYELWTDYSLFGSFGMYETENKEAVKKVDEMDDDVPLSDEDLTF